MTGAEGTAGAAMEAATEAAVTKEGVRDVQSSGFVDADRYNQRSN